MQHLQHTTPERETGLAREALDAGDLCRAMLHASRALCFDPSDERGRSLLDEVLAETSDPLALARTSAPRTDYLVAAISAYVHAQRGELREALALLCTAAKAKPTIGFLQWGAAWAARPDAAGQLDVAFVLTELLPPLLGIVADVPSPMALDDERAATVQAAAELLAVLRPLLGEQARLLFVSSVVERRLAHFNEAIAHARRAFQLEPDWKATIGVACAYRDAGRVDDAIGWYRHALQLEPERVSALLDVGDALLEAQRWSEATTAYEQYLALQPGHVPATAAVAFCRYRRSGELVHKWQLLELAGHSARAWDLFGRIESPLPYVNMIPPAADATANGVRDLIRRLSRHPEEIPSGTIELKVTHPESPSVLTAFRVWARTLGLAVDIDVEAELVQAPDPRLPKAQVDFVLWRYEGTRPRPSQPAPSSPVVAAVEGIAREAFHLERYDSLARDVASEWGPGWINQFLSTMLHPPLLPSTDADPLEWVHRIQLAATFVAVRSAESWDARKRTLFSLALGPVDWTVDAALVVLAKLAREDAAARRDVEQLFTWLEGQIPDRGYTCYEYPLTCAWLSLDGLEPVLRQRLEARQDALERGHRPAPGEPTD